MKRQKFLSIPTPAVILLIFMFVWIFGTGGCGGSSSNNFADNSPADNSPEDYQPSNVNSILSGAWRYTSGTVTANLNGTTHNMTVRDFAAYFTNCNVANENGSAVFAAVAPLQGEYLNIPLAFDETSVTTKRTDVNEWTADTEHGTFTIRLLSDTTAQLTGNVKWQGNVVTADVDVTLRKVTSPSATLDIDTVLNGTWQTAMNINDNGSGTATGGGYVFLSSGDVVPLTSAFANMVFEDTSINNGKTTLTANALMAAFDQDGTLELPVNPLITEDYPVELTHIFANVYRLKFGENDKGVFMLNDENTAYFIVSSSEMLDAFNVTAENHVIFPLTKKTGTDTVIITDQVGSTWTATTGAGIFSSNNTSGGLTMENFTVSFPEADVENKKVTITTNGTFKTSTGREVPVTYNGLELEVERVGYNTYFSETEHGSTFMVTLLDDDTAMVSTKVIYDANTTANIIALLTKTDPDINAVWKGAWRYASGDVAMTQNGTTYPLTIQDFAGYFDEVDIDGTAGTAKFSLVASLSTDQFLIPMVFDELTLNTTRTSSNEWTAATQHGTFTIKLLSPSKAELSGTLNYPVSVYTLSINLDVTVSRVASATLPPVNIDSVLDGTWQTAGLTGGGFMVMNNSLYFGSYTEAGIAIKDTSLSGGKTTATASGCMVTRAVTGAEGPVVPITLINREAKISHIFSNFYRVEFSEGMKGVFVVQGENTAYAIVEVIDNVSGIHTHAMFILEKKTGADTVDLSSLHGTSWDVTAYGVMHNASGNTSISSQNLVISIGTGSTPTISLTGALTAGAYTMPVSQTGTTTFEDIGYNLWTTKSANNSDIIFLMSSDTQGFASMTFTAENNTFVSLSGMLRRK